MHRDPVVTVIGAPARDGQDDPPPACRVCGRADTVVTDRRTERSALIAVDLGPGDRRMVCAADYEAALKHVGPGRGREALHVRTCSAPHPAPDHGRRFEVVASWPLQSYAPPPYWLACGPHMAAALDVLATEPVSGG